MNEGQYRLFKAIWLAVMGISLVLFLALLQRHLDNYGARVAKASENGSVALQSLANGTLAGVAAEQKHLDMQLQETRKATADIHDLIIHTDINLNGKKGVLTQINANILPDMASVLGDTDRSVRDFSRDSHVVLAGLDHGVVGVVSLEEALTARVNDPAYDKILADASESMHNLTGTTDEAHGIATEMHGAAIDFHQFTHRELAPVRGIKNTIKEILSWAGNVRLAIGF